MKTDLIQFFFNCTLSVKVDDTPPTAGNSNRISLSNRKPVPYNYHPHLKVRPMLGQGLYKVIIIEYR